MPDTIESLRINDFTADDAEGYMILCAMLMTHFKATEVVLSVDAVPLEEFEIWRRTADDGKMTVRLVTKSEQMAVVVDEDKTVN